MRTSLASYITLTSHYKWVLRSCVCLNFWQNKVAVAVLQVHLWEPRSRIQHNQLWYEDERGIIRSRLNGYVLQLTGDC